MEHRIEDKGNRALTSPHLRWQKLESLATDLEYREKGSPQKVLVFSGLYRALLHDLSNLRGLAMTPELRRYLHSLAVRCYTLIYQKPGLRLLDFIWFLAVRFPRLVRQRIHLIIAAFLIFSVSTGVGFLCIHKKSKFIDLVIPVRVQERIADSLSYYNVRTGKGVPNDAFSVSSYIMFNNIRVAFLAFATGILLGAGTIHVLIFNGLHLGGLAALYHDAGWGTYFWALILPHGVVELSAIFLASAGGFMLGCALLNPGLQSRSERLAEAGHEAAQILFCTIPLFIFAGLVETYITPSLLPESVKFLIASIFAGLLVLYFAFGDRIATTGHEA